MGNGVAAAGTCRGAKQHDFSHLISKLLVFHGADLHEGGQRFPDFGIAPGVIPLQFLQTITHLFGHKPANGAHPSVGLQGAAAHIEGDIWGIKHPTQGQEVAGHHLLNVVAYKNLVAVEPNFPLLPIPPTSELGKIENPLQVVGVVGVEVHPQEGIPLEGVEVAVEVDVVVVAEVPGALAPGGLALVHRLTI